MSTRPSWAATTRSRWAWWRARGKCSASCGELAAVRGRRPRARPDAASRAAGWPTSRRGGRGVGTAHRPRPHLGGAPRCGRERVLADLRAALPDDGILLSDVGVHHNWIVQEWRPGRTRHAAAELGLRVHGLRHGRRARRPAGRPGHARRGGGRRRRLPHAARAWWPPRSSTTSRPSGWSGTTGATSPSATSSAATSAPGASWPPRFSYAATGAPYSADYAAMARSMGAQGLRVDDRGRPRPAR